MHIGTCTCKTIHLFTCIMTIEIKNMLLYDKSNGKGRGSVVFLNKVKLLHNGQHI